MEQGYAVPVDSRFIINQLGLLGEKYLEIMPGLSADLVTAKTNLRGEDSVSMESIMKVFEGLGGKLDVTLSRVNDGVLSPANQEALAASLGALSVTLKNFELISAQVKDGQGTLGRFLADPAVFNNLDELTADLKANPWKLFYRPKK